MFREESNLGDESMYAVKIPALLLLSPFLKKTFSVKFVLLL